MTKFRKFIPVLVCSFLIAGGSVAAICGLNNSLAKEAQATTDCGPVAFSGIAFNLAGGGDGAGIYLTAPENSVTFSGWDYKIHPVGGQGGLFIGNRDMGNVEMVKFSATEYYVGVGTTLTDADAGKAVTITGEWTYSDGENDHTFAVSPEFKVRWAGANWGNYFDLEDYETVSLLDCGIADSSGVAINTEDDYDYTFSNLYHNGFALANDTGSYALQFRIEALDNEDMTGHFYIRVGSTSAWGTGHMIQVLLNNFWGAKGWGDIQESKNDVVLQESGEIPVDLDAGASHLFEMGVVKIKNSSNFNVFVKYDNAFIYNSSWLLVDESERTTRVGLYYGGTNLAISNTIEAPAGTVGLTAGVPNGTAGVHFHCTQDLVPGFSNWRDYGIPFSNDAVTLNGASITAGKTNYFKKVGAAGYNVYYISFTDLGVTPKAGDKLFIGGTFKFVETTDPELGDRVPVKLHKISLKTSAFFFDGTDWLNYDLGLLEDASVDDLPADSLLRNIGLYNSDQSKCALKNFDQTPETLVYKKDLNNDAGLFFTSSASKSSEVRFYLPGNDYKAESMGYAIRSVSFDYMIVDGNKEVGTEAGASLTADGFYFDSAASTTTSYMVQLMDKKSKIYYCFDAPLVADGQLHTFTLNIAYSDVTGIVMKLFKFNGTFFVTNLRFDANEYNAALNSLVYDSLKMYSYRTESGTCTEYYAGAKAAYEALTDSEKGIFNTDAAYGSARARLTAWALANGEVFDPISGTFTANTHGINATSLDKNNVVVISVVICAIALISAAGVMLVIKKRKYNK